jgi:hypothetical protein
MTLTNEQIAELRQRLSDDPEAIAALDRLAELEQLTVKQSRTIFGLRQTNANLKEKQEKYFRNI